MFIYSSGNNIRILDNISRDSYIISGRINKHSEIKRNLRNLGFSNIYLRPNDRIPETSFKIKMCKKLGITLYIEDRLYVIKRLRFNKINAKDVREWEKQ